jgi:hypothetical protein
MSDAEQPVGLGSRWLQTDRSGAFFTVFLPNSRAIGLQVWQKLYSGRLGAGADFRFQRSKSDRLLV